MWVKETLRWWSQPIPPLTETSWDTPSQKHPAEMLPNSWPTETMGGNKWFLCWSHLLWIISYTAIETGTVSQWGLLWLPYLKFQATLPPYHFLISCLVTIYLYHFLSLSPSLAPSLPSPTLSLSLPTLMPVNWTKPKSSWLVIYLVGSCIYNIKETGIPTNLMSHSTYMLGSKTNLFSYFSEVVI